MLFSDFSEKIFVNLNFRIFSENYHKIIEQLQPIYHTM